MSSQASTLRTCAGATSVSEDPHFTLLRVGAGCRQTAPAKTVQAPPFLSRRTTGA